MRSIINWLFTRNRVVDFCLSTSCSCWFLIYLSRQLI